MNTRIPKKYAMSISSWFCIPEQGMKDFEILCRGSAFLVPSKNKKFSSKYHVVTSSHVVAPWRWPSYFPLEWLKVVNETHVHYTVEIRDEKGIFMTQQDLVPQSYHHPNRDLAILHLQQYNESDFNPDQAALAGEGTILFDLGLHPIQLFPGEMNQKVTDLGSGSKADIGRRLWCHGHEMTHIRGEEEMNNSTERSQNDNRIPIPRVVGGSITHRTKNQVFARMTQELTDGMCGGPVVDEVTQTALGVLEGTVPQSYPDGKLGGAGVFVESDVIQVFLEDIEADSATVRASLLKPEKPAWLHVGADQDESKMDISKISD